MKLSEAEPLADASKSEMILLAAISESASIAYCVEIVPCVSARRRIRPAEAHVTSETVTLDTLTSAKSAMELSKTAVKEALLSRK